MRIESVSYIFSEAELGALLEILDCRAIPFSPVPDVTGGLASLEKSLLVTRQGEQFAVDKIAAFLTKAISESNRYLCLYNQDHYYGLFYNLLATVLLCRDRGRWILTPFPTFEEGKDALKESVPSNAEALTAVVNNTRGRWIGEISKGRDRPLKLAHAAEWAYYDEKPSGGEEEQWKL